MDDSDNGYYIASTDYELESDDDSRSVAASTDNDSISSDGDKSNITNTDDNRLNDLDESDNSIILISDESDSNDNQSPPLIQNEIEQDSFTRTKLQDKIYCNECIEHKDSSQFYGGNLLICAPCIGKKYEECGIPSNYCLFCCNHQSKLRVHTERFHESHYDINKLIVDHYLQHPNGNLDSTIVIPLNKEKHNIVFTKYINKITQEHGRDVVSNDNQTELDAFARIKLQNKIYCFDCVKLKHSSQFYSGNLLVCAACIGKRLHKNNNLYCLFCCKEQTQHISRHNKRFHFQCDFINTKIMSHHKLFPKGGSGPDLLIPVDKDKHRFIITDYCKSITDNYGKGTERFCGYCYQLKPISQFQKINLNTCKECNSFK